MPVKQDPYAALATGGNTATNTIDPYAALATGGNTATNTIDPYAALTQKSTASVRPDPVAAMLAVNPDRNQWVSPIEFLKGGISSIYSMLRHPVDTIEAMGQPFVASGMAPGGMYPGQAPFTAKGIASLQKAQLEASREQGKQAEFIAHHPAFSLGGVVIPALVTHGVTKIPDAYESTLRALTNTGSGPVKTAVTEALAKNADIDAANARIEESNLANNHILEMRRDAERNLQQQTASYYAKMEAADAQAKAVENSAWGRWRQKITGKTIDGGLITGPLQRLRLDSPEVDRTLNQLEPRGDEVPQESPYAQVREQLSQQQFGKEYSSLSPVKQSAVDDLLHANGYAPEPIAFDPQAGQPISIDRVQRASSILQRYIRSGRFEGPLLGEMKQVAKVLRNAVTRASAENGAAGDLDAARDATITYQGAFGKEPRTPVTTRSVLERKANPEAFRDRAELAQLDRVRRHDPSLVDAYRQVKTAREAVKKLPSEDQLRRALQQTSPRRTLSTADLQRARERALAARQSWVAHRGFWVATWPIFEAMRAIWGGRIPEIPKMALESAGTLATVQAAGELLKYPPMLRFLTTARPEDVALIPPELRGDLPGLVSIAQQQGIKVTPALITAAATTGAKSASSSFISGGNGQ